MASVDRIYAPFPRAMTLLLRSLRLFWTRYFVPGALERDPLFRATMDGLTRRGLTVAGVLGLTATLLYVSSHLVIGKTLVWTQTGLDTGTHIVMWDKALIGGLSLILILLGRGRPGVTLGRAAMGLILLLAAWSLISEDVGRMDFTFTAGWLTLVMLITVGTVPFQPWQTAVLCLSIGGLYVGYAMATGPSFEPPIAGVPISRIIFLGLVAFLCTSMSASLYVSRFEQYRALRRVGRLKEYLSARSRALERSLKRVQSMQDQLVQSEKLASLGQLTAGIAHEIKNPLNFVNNFAQLSQELLSELHEELTEDPGRSVREAMADMEDLFADIRSNADKIAAHGRRADGIVKSMLAHSRSTAGEKRPVDVNRLLGEYVGLAYHGTRARYSMFNADIVRDFDESLGEVPLIPEEIGRVFLNLLDNAFHAVYLRSKSAPDGYEPRLRVATAQDGAHVLIEIQDNGTGIPERLQERVFEPFFTTKPSGEGTGLGLSLAYEIVTQGHGGTMEVDTEEGIGTTFTIALPLRPDGVDVPIQPAQAATLPTA